LHFLHRPQHPADPRFLRERRRFLDHEFTVLHVMERHRDHLQEEIEAARAAARAAHVSSPHHVELDDRIPADAKRLVLIGVGNAWHHDDAAGLEVARRLRGAEPDGVMISDQEGEPESLLAAWDGAREALVFDGVSDAGEAGKLHRFDVARDSVPPDLFRPTTHALGIADAIELGRELDVLPPWLVVYGIAGENFEEGVGLTPAVEDTVERLVAELHAELDTRGGHPED